MKPIRIQMKRTKGFNLQQFSKKLNGLDCKTVSRPTKWGNPYEVKKYSLCCALLFYQDDIYNDLVREYEIKKELRGKNLACWCPLNQKCHADILLKIANE